MKWVEFGRKNQQFESIIIKGPPTPSMTHFKASPTRGNSYSILVAGSNVRDVAGCCWKVVKCFCPAVARSLCCVSSTVASCWLRGSLTNLVSFSSLQTNEQHRLTPVKAKQNFTVLVTAFNKKYRQTCILSLPLYIILGLL